MTADWRRLNVARWDEVAAIHAAPRGYDLSSHRAGRGAFDAIVEAELGSVDDLRILHLQSHIGHDTIALAQRGAAHVVGVDFSPASIAFARSLASDLTPGRVTFVETDIQGAAAAMPDRHGQFDLVFTTWGTICWIDDLRRWAETIATFLRPHGALYFADAHPAALVFDGIAEQGDPDARPAWLVPYFDRSGRVFDEPGDYADVAARVSNRHTIQWMHPVSDIVSALLDAGLRLQWLHEHAQVTWRMFPGLSRQPGGLWGWPGRPWLPLSLSLRAVRL